MLESPHSHRASWRAIVFFALLTGSHAAMSTPPGDSSDYKQPPAPTYQVPLPFYAHNFNAYCYNTRRCSVIYNNYEFGYHNGSDVLSPPAPSGDYKNDWNASYLDIRAFPGPAEVKWTDKDGGLHEAKVDLAKIFKDKLTWHNVPKADMADFWKGSYAGDPDIILEVNDRTANVYIAMFVPTRTEQIPGNKDSNFRKDWFLAWSHSY